MSPDEIADASENLSAHERKMGLHALTLLRKKPGAALNANETAVLHTLVALMKQAKSGDGTPTTHIGYDPTKDADGPTGDPNDAENNEPQAPVKPPDDDDGGPEE